FDRLGKEIHRDTFRRGSVVGLFSMLLPDRSHLHVEAVEPTTVIHLGLDDLLRLTAKYREFQLTMFRIAAHVVKQLVMVDRELPKRAAVGVVHHSDASRPLAVELTRRLRQLGESPCVAGDDERWRPKDGIPHKLLCRAAARPTPQCPPRGWQWPSGGRNALPGCSNASRLRPTPVRPHSGERGATTSVQTCQFFNQTTVSFDSGGRSPGDAKMYPVPG